MTVLIKIWCGGQVGPGTLGHSGKRGIGFMSKCWKRIAKEHGWPDPRCALQGGAGLGMGLPMPGLLLP